MRTNGSSNLPHGYGINKVPQVESPRINIYKDREKQNEEKKESLYKQKAFLEFFKKCQIKAMPSEENNKEEKKSPFTR